MDSTLLELPDSLFSVEQSSGLFERAALGLNGELPDKGKLEAEPRNVDDVVLPLEGILSNGVDISVETGQKILEMRRATNGAYWLKMSELVTATFMTANILARMAYGVISTVYETRRGVYAIA